MVYANWNVQSDLEGLKYIIGIPFLSSPVNFACFLAAWCSIAFNGVVLLIVTAKILYKGIDYLIGPQSTKSLRMESWDTSVGELETNSAVADEKSKREMKSQPKHME